MWLDQNLDSTRDDAERGWQNTPSVYADLDHDGARDRASRWTTASPTAGSRSRSTRACCRPASTASTSASRYVGVHQDPAWDFAFKCLAPARGCVRNVEVNRARRQRA